MADEGEDAEGRKNRLKLRKLGKDDVGGGPGQGSKSPIKGAKATGKTVKPHAPLDVWVFECVCVRAGRAAARRTAPTLPRGIKVGPNERGGNRDPYRGSTLYYGGLPHVILLRGLPNCFPPSL